MSFYPSEQSKPLSACNDVNISNPSNGDGLVHDGNDWKNIPITTKEQWKKNGAYNLCPNDGTTQVSYGLTFTFNPTGYKKGVVHVTGTKSDSGSHGINLSGVFNLKAGTYKILDGLSNNNLGIALIDNSTSTFILQTYNQHKATFTLATDTEVRCTIVFLGAQNTTFDDYIYPMITTDLTAVPITDYEPHAKTNGELTEDVSDISKRFANNFKFLGEIDASQIDNIGSTFFPEINTGSRCYYSFGYVISGTGECWVNGYEYKGGMYGFQIRYLFNGTVMKRYKNNSNTWSSWENV